VRVQWWCWHHLNYWCRHCFRISLAHLTIKRTRPVYQAPTPAPHLPEAAQRPQIRRHHENTSHNPARPASGKSP
jgi:hypothetical protein